MATMNTPPSYAQATWESEYRDCARSREYKEGALRGLQKAFGEAASPPGVPYAGGTVQLDAWRLGFLDGLAEGRDLRERGQE